MCEREEEKRRNSIYEGPIMCVKTVLIADKVIVFFVNLGDRSVNDSDQDSNEPALHPAV